MRRFFSSMFGGLALCGFAWTLAATVLGLGNIAIVCAIVTTIGAILCALLEKN